jgi:hypothetical protein
MNTAVQLVGLEEFEAEVEVEVRQNVPPFITVGAVPINYVIGESADPWGVACRLSDS